MRRLRTREQFQALLSDRPVARTEHFALHRLSLQPAAEGHDGTRQAVFRTPAAPWVGAMVPKRWARRAVTRNVIRRQIFAVSESLQPPLPAAAHLVRLRTAFAPKRFPSASSVTLKTAVRAELTALFAQQESGRA
ncbi:ribonuclease P protein component [Ottowia testudinis]|uniref:Ribonuclease P protein component n=1 Tax=Ottowia testudinis TaxID=2816950 RepID=A0A975CJB3_9BURK|nr:ribonuclease P protein component [Ottowia testudinis]QTD47513.1 ribonuclease P protein component [Ottowia testudinis]